MLLIINKLCNLNYFFCVPFISAIRVKYLGQTTSASIVVPIQFCKIFSPKLQMEGFFLSLNGCFAIKIGLLIPPK